MIDRNPPKLGANTRLTHAGRRPSGEYGFVNPGVQRGSTVLFPNSAARMEASGKRLEQTLIYGLLGTETHHALEDVISEIEGAKRCQIVSSGLAAITTALMAFLRSGDHCLIVDSAYGPGRVFANDVLSTFGVDITYYHPHNLQDFRSLFRPNTKVVFCESPGSYTFEMQDVPAFSAVAHEHGARVLIDNTWGLSIFQPFEHGADVSIQALTKYAGGHSDIMLGAISTVDDEDWGKVRSTALALGQYASPDDCWLALRGTRTLAVRMRQQAQSAMEIATWLQHRPEVDEVLYPPLPGSAGHDLWQRDYIGASSVFAVRLAKSLGARAAERFADALKLFGIGSSWGGYESLVVPVSIPSLRRHFEDHLDDPLLRLHVGLEDAQDLLNDLEQALVSIGS